MNNGNYHGRICALEKRCKDLYDLMVDRSFSARCTLETALEKNKDIPQELKNAIEDVIYSMSFMEGYLRK